MLPQNVSGIQANVFYPPTESDKAPGVVFIHGWQSGQDRSYELAEQLAGLGFVCLTFDLRGHGKTPGDLTTLTLKDFLEDAIAAFDFLARDNRVDPTQITIVGSSFGSYLSALLTAHRPAARIVLRVPADYSDEDFNRPKPTGPEADRWREQPRTWNSSAALRAVHSFHGKILIVESEKDDQIPHQVIQNYVDAVSHKDQLTYVVMKGAPHTLKNHPEFKREFAKILIVWLTK